MSYFLNIKLKMLFNIIRVANQLVKYKDIVGFLMEVIKDSSEDVSNYFRKIKIGFESFIYNQRFVWETNQSKNKYALSISVNYKNDEVDAKTKNLEEKLI